MSPPSTPRESTAELRTTSGETRFPSESSASILSHQVATTAEPSSRAVKRSGTSAVSRRITGEPSTPGRASRTFCSSAIPSINSGAAESNIVSRGESIASIALRSPLR